MSRTLTKRIAPVLFLLPAILLSVAHADANPCRIEVVEKTSCWPVPLVELRTINGLRLVTDNAGVIAVDQAELLGREVFFFIEGHGYEVPADGFGYRGVRLTPRPGETLRVEVSRQVIARRLGRITGAGLFAHSQRSGVRAGTRESGVVGCDSIQTAVYRGRHFWLWGDTSLFHYPLGLFHASAATSGPRPIASFKPPLAIEFDYFRNDRGRPRDVARMPGTGPTWLTGMVSLPDNRNVPRLVASYMKVKPPLDVYQIGLCVWNETTSSFEHLKVVWKKTADQPKPPPHPHGHPAEWIDSNGRRWVLFGNPLPKLRCPATFEAWQDGSQWELLNPPDSLPSSTDGSPVKLHSGSIAWNSYRKRWVTVFMQGFGKPSAFGELWYAEADEPTGPWSVAVKILSHNNYTFYNPRIHPEFTPDESPFLLFEGTYTQQFANRPHPTPRYDYNQIMYRLDLDDDRLKPARSSRP